MRDAAVLNLSMEVEEGTSEERSPLEEAMVILSRGIGEFVTASRGVRLERRQE